MFAREGRGEGRRGTGGDIRMHRLISRRAAIIRLFASGAALGLGAFATTTRAAAHPEQPGFPLSRLRERGPGGEGSLVPIPVRLAEVVHEGADFRDGAAEGISRPAQGGAWTLTAEQPGGSYTSPPFELTFPCTHVGVHWRTDPISTTATAVVPGPGSRSRSGRAATAPAGLPGDAYTSKRTAATVRRIPAFDETFGALVGGPTRHLAPVSPDLRRGRHPSRASSASP